MEVQGSVAARPGPDAFDDPPPDPVALFAAWSADAAAVDDVTAAALATVDRDGRPSNRMIRLLHVTDRGFVFSSHSGSQKGRDARDTGVGAVVFHWPGAGEQVILSGELRITDDAVSDRLWAERDRATHPMSVATVQSAPLDDEDDLRARAARLAAAGDPLPRPATWVGFELVATSVEFWHVGTERLHRRLRYDLGDDGWRARRLQP
ncbi:pyridoxal 5'-phosphate synthase [Saccharothrix sp. BKS2]|uniref:pyridoxal 5'-phosphate synthase n=1 Tax=Saccharothrix sp. BKS2 TaxID=3064400 RepID=UPI0039E83D2D